jgi:3-hydroxyisobutyrate dehydrogenase-like beta-hydroxyacid dehydrogenase
MTAVGLIGLGLLGDAVAARLLAAGHEVLGFDVDAGRVAALVARGGRAAGSAAEVGGSVDIAATVLPTLEAVEAVILGPTALLARARPHLTVLQMSTISPALTERLDGEVARRGATFLDCPVSGTSGMVLRGDGMFFVGGDPVAFERWQPLLPPSCPARSTSAGPATPCS